MKNYMIISFKQFSFPAAVLHAAELVWIIRL